MRKLVISYSKTGNNHQLAEAIVSRLNAEHIILKKEKTMGSIILDVLLNRVPKVEELPTKLSQYDWVILIGPVWLGKFATPLRPYLKALRSYEKNIAVFSLNGGFDGDNKGLKMEIEKISKRKCDVLVEFHIASIMPKDPAPSRDDVSNYKLSVDDMDKITATAIDAVKSKE